MIKILTICSIIVSILLVLCQQVIAPNHILLRKYPYILQVLKKPTLIGVAWMALYIYRKVGHMKLFLFVFLTCANMVSIFAFGCVRITVLTLTVIPLNIYIIYTLLAINASLWGLFRMIYRVGLIINRNLIDDPNLVLVLPEFDSKFGKPTLGMLNWLGRKISGLPNDPGKIGIDRHTIMAGGTFIATTGAAIFASFVAYDTHQIAKDMERSADLGEVNAGLRSKESYQKKWGKSD